MKHYHLTRSYLKDRTVGQIITDTSHYETLERPWLNNKPGVSCIPEGTYIVEPDSTGRFQYYRVTNVPNRTFIEFHHGTKPEHSNGCILLDATRFKNEHGNKPFLLTVRSFNVWRDDWD